MGSHEGGWGLAVAGALPGARPWGPSAGEPEYQRPYLWRGQRGLLDLNAEIIANRKPPTQGHRWPRDEAPHGTRAAARRHNRAGEPLCESCRKAERRYKEDRRAARMAGRAPASGRQSEVVDKKPAQTA